MKRTVFFFALFVLAACKKEHAEAADTEAPLIKMASPFNNQTFAVGQTASINGRVTDNTKIEEVHLEITNKTSGCLLHGL